MKILNAILSAAAIVFIGGMPAWGATPQLSTARIDSMPNMPAQYQMRDWRKAARDYDALVFNYSATGQYLPAIWTDTSHIYRDVDGFGLPSYAGSPYQKSGNAGESINCIAAVLGATLAGIDKSNQGGRNFADMLSNYYSPTLCVVGNNAPAANPVDFWYGCFPTMLYWMVWDKYPSDTATQSRLLGTADKFYNAMAAMKPSGALFPDFNHTGFDFGIMQPFYNGQFREPDAGIVFSWVSLMAWQKFGQPRFIQGAQWGMNYLQSLPASQNPYYEIFMPYGVYLAARLNAEFGATYDVQKFIDWNMGPSVARPNWGVAANNWGGYEVMGLASSLDDGGGYAFAMNTFNQAAAHVPMVRYDKRYARAIGKWMLNMANSSRFFYANALDAAHQSCKTWADANDKNYAIAYEGFRQQGRNNNVAAGDYSTPAGQIVSGSYTETTCLGDNKCEALREADAGGADRLEHIWRVPKTAGTSSQLLVNAYITLGGDPQESFKFSWSTSPTGPWTEMFTVTETAFQGLPNHWHTVTASASGDTYVRVEDTRRTSGGVLDTLNVDALFLLNELSVQPYSMGDAVAGYPRNMPLDFGLYGSSHVGLMGGSMTTTTIEGILVWDCLKTDYYHNAAHPTYLIYNPHAQTKTVQVAAPTTATDVYDIVSDQFVARGVIGAASVRMPPDTAMVLVMVPANATMQVTGRKLIFNGVTADFNTARGFLPPGPLAPDPQTTLLIKFDGNITDSSPNNWPTTFSAIAGMSTPGFINSQPGFGQCLTGNGGALNGALVSSSVISGAARPPMTIESWIYMPPDRVNDEYNFPLVDFAGGRFQFFIRHAGTPDAGVIYPSVSIYNGSLFESNYWRIGVTDGWTDGSWHHVALTYDPTRTTAPVELFFDGVRFAANTQGSTPPVTSDFERVAEMAPFGGRVWPPPSPTENLMPLIGSADELRVSRIIRYPQPAPPSAVEEWPLYNEQQPNIRRTGTGADAGHKCPHYHKEHT
ncbi:MAG: LamG-like jellyroll fold domain-containing protein [bacterium]